MRRGQVHPQERGLTPGLHVAVIGRPGTCTGVHVTARLTPTGPPLGSGRQAHLEKAGLMALTVGVALVVLGCEIATENFGSRFSTSVACAAAAISLPICAKVAARKA